MPQLNSPLPPGSMLQRYRIAKTISIGGFSIVYLAHGEDGLAHAIKEFMPSSLLLRSSGSRAAPQNAEDQRRLDSGMRLFFSEAEALSHIDSPSIVKISDFFLENNTAYLAMPFEHGQTLGKLIRSSGGHLSDATLQGAALGILGGLRALHQRGILHLDLKPSNIWIRAGGEALIIDFGTSLIGKATARHRLAAITPGFAAPEQHPKTFDLSLISPQTDLYNLGATLFSCIEGKPPQQAPERLVSDKMPILASRWAGQYGRPLLAEIDAMLMLNPTLRPLSAKSALDTISRYAPASANGFFENFCHAAFVKNLF